MASCNHNNNVGKGWQLGQTFWQHPQKLGVELLLSPAGSPSIQWDKLASANDDIDHPFILLHLFFDTAWTAGLLKRAFFGDYDTCADFWNSAEDRQHLRQRLCRGHSAATPSKMVLVVLHGDGG